MLPVLFKVGPIPIYSFGIFLLLGTLLGIFVSWKKSREYHLDDDKFFDLVFSGLLGGILLGRVWYIVEHFADFGLNPLKWVWFTHYVGISFIGGLIGALFSLWLVARHYREDIYRILDLTSIGAALALSLSWVGAFLDGVPLGLSVKTFGLSYPGLEGRYFPVQFVAVIAFAVLYRLLWYWEGRYRTFEWYRAGKSSAKPGFLFGFFLIFIGLIHTTVSLLTQGAPRVIGFPFEGWFGLLALVAGIVLLYARSGRRLSQDLAGLRPQRARDRQ